MIAALSHEDLQTLTIFILSLFALLHAALHLIERRRRRK